jgi:hypothetical protein
MCPALVEESTYMSEHRSRGTLPHLLRTIHLAGPLPPDSGREPSDDELLHLIEGTLTDEQRARLEAELLGCPFSSDRVAVVRAALAEAGVELPRLWAVWSSDD